MAEEDPFAGFESQAEIAGYIYAEHGLEALGTLLDMQLNPASYDVLDDSGEVPKPADMDEFMNIASEFQELGLNEAAEIVLEAAKGAVSADATCLGEGTYVSNGRVFPLRPDCRCSKCHPLEEME